MSSPEVQNCIDVIAPYVDAVTRPGMPSVQLLGGVGSVALQHEATVIIPGERRIVAPADLYLSNYRDDGNMRDVETLVLSAEDSEVDAVDFQARKLMESAVLVETFRFGSLEKVDTQRANPLGFDALKTFLSDRYIPAGTSWSPDGPQAVRALFPFAVPIDYEALESWTLQIGDDIEVPVPSPGATVINYLTRSISGLRGKDADKVEAMATAVFDKAPETVDWIIDGPGKEQFDLARVLHTLREPKDNRENPTIGGRLLLQTYGEHKGLSEHPAFMLKEADSRTKKRVISLARLKSRLLHIAESNPAVVTLYQRHAEQRMSTVTHNR